MMVEELKTQRAIGGTKRKRYDIFLGNSTSYAHRRISKLAKKVKAHNPSHMVAANAATIFPSISTTGTLYDLGTGIAQGDNPYDRFSSQCIFKRLLIKAGLIPGSTSSTPSNVRVTIYRGTAGAVFAANMSGTYNPITYSTSTMVIFDRFYQVGATSGTVGYSTALNLNIRLKNHKQKFATSAAGSTAGDALYLVIQSDKASGTTAPVIVGTVEIYFDPT